MRAHSFTHRAAWNLEAPSHIFNCDETGMPLNPGTVTSNSSLKTCGAAAPRT